MKIIALNGSPRKGWNTEKLLQSALNGAKELCAETELVQLYDQEFKGCISCFACKVKGSSTRGFLERFLFPLDRYIMQEGSWDTVRPFILATLISITIILAWITICLMNGRRQHTERNNFQSIFKLLLTWGNGLFRNQRVRNPAPHFLTEWL